MVLPTFVLNILNLTWFKTAAGIRLTCSQRQWWESHRGCLWQGPARHIDKHKAVRTSSRLKWGVQLRNTEENDCDSWRNLVKDIKDLQTICTNCEEQSFKVRPLKSETRRFSLCCCLYLIKCYLPSLRVMSEFFSCFSIHKIPYWLIQINVNGSNTTKSWYSILQKCQKKMSSIWFLEVWRAVICQKNNQQLLW